MRTVRECDVWCIPGVFLVYLSLRPSSHEICVYPGDTANFFGPISDHINCIKVCCSKTSRITFFLTFERRQQPIW